MTADVYQNCPDFENEREEHPNGPCQRAAPNRKARALWECVTRIASIAFGRPKAA